jgi:hypothetical protein
MLRACCLLWAMVGMAAAQTATPPAKDTTIERPEATVTFYSGGSILRGIAPGTHSDVFQGCIFEQDTQLTCITWRRYAVVKLAPGLHVFSASLSEKHGADNSQTPLLLEAGKSYYLRATDKHVRIEVVPVPIGMGVVTVPTTLHPVRGFLDVVSCDMAAKDTADFAPAGIRIAGKDWAHRPRDGAPACPAVTNAP